VRRENAGMSTSLPADLETALNTGNVDTVLQKTIEHFGCAAGTVHWLDAASGMLKLAAHFRIPPPIVEIIGMVPIGKGIAGLAAEKREPISLCNLQTDTSGQARPAAKTTGMEGSLAVPMIVDGDLRGVLGIAKPTAYDWSEEEKSVVLAVGARLGELRG
jgi:L-methionine (R)-S-oxide reductase